MNKSLLLLIISFLHLQLSLALDIRQGLLPNFDGYPNWVSAADRNILLQNTSMLPNIIVAKDGTGDYKTIVDAVEAISKLREGTDRFIIYVKKGVYNEYIEIKMQNIMFIGDGIDATVVTGNKNSVDGIDTIDSATFAVVGDGFIARDMTFDNTAGPQKHQAVAFRSSSNLSILYRCSFRGYQDTLYVHRNYQFYRNCDIYGTVDFIFGDAAVLFQYCNIYVRKPMNNQKNTVTAQGRKNLNKKTGTLIQYSVITASPDLILVQDSIKSYLGRPWKKYSTTVIMQSEIDGVIDPAGWLPWRGDFALRTLYYVEYLNTGAGAKTERRVKWPGFHIITNDKEAKNLSVENFFGWH